MSLRIKLTADKGEASVEIIERRDGKTERFEFRAVEDSGTMAISPQASIRHTKMVGRIVLAALEIDDPQ